MPTWLRTKTRKGNLSPKRRWNHFRSLHSQSLSWFPVGSLANYTHTRKQCQTTVFYIISTFIPSLCCKLSCRVCYIPSFVFTALLRCHKYVVACFRGCRYICMYIHSRAFSVSCCSILWFMKYIDRMQRRGALVALHKGAQECCRHGSRHRSCKSSAALTGSAVQIEVLRMGC